MRTLQVGDRPTKLAQAVAEVGRIDKTIHILTSIDDEFKRRRTLTQLNRGEDRHSLARPFFTANEVSYGSVIERDKRTSSAHWDL
jgi:TnpA family transposase